MTRSYKEERLALALASRREDIAYVQVHPSGSVG